MATDNRQIRIIFPVNGKICCQVTTGDAVHFGFAVKVKDPDGDFLDFRAGEYRPEFRGRFVPLRDAYRRAMEMTEGALVPWSDGAVAELVKNAGSTSPGAELAEGIDLD